MKRTNTAKWMEKQNRWQINVQKDGIRRTFTSSKPGRAGAKEANAKADAWLDDNIMEGNLKLSVLFDKWIEELKLTTSKDHWRKYDGFGKNWINPQIGGKKISNVTEQNLQDVILAAHKAKLSKKTMSNLKACMTAFIKYCRKRKATTLVVENLTIPKNAPVGVRTILQPDDLKILMNDDMTEARGEAVVELYINAYRFEVATGLRPGEVIGLKHEDIDGSRVHIRRSINHSGITTAGKNENARRTFMLTPLAKEILKRQEELMKSTQIRSDYIFPNEYGDHIVQTTYYKRWVRYRSYHGMSEASPYELRHTFVSVVKSLPEGMLKQVVGHSESMDTFGVYSHDVEGDLEEAAKKIQSIFLRVLD